MKRGGNRILAALIAPCLLSAAAGCGTMEARAPSPSAAANYQEKRRQEESDSASTAPDRDQPPSSAFDPGPTPDPGDMAEAPFPAPVPPPSPPGADAPSFRALSAAEQADLWLLAAEDAKRLAQERLPGRDYRVESVSEHTVQSGIARAELVPVLLPGEHRLPPGAAPLSIEYSKGSGQWRPVRVLDDQRQPLAGALQMLKR